MSETPFTSDYDTLACDPMQDADEGTEAKLGAFPNPKLEECPVVPLGFSRGYVHFAMPEGELRKEVASKVAGMLRTDIFACQAGVSFLTPWRDADQKFQRELCAIWFVRQCRLAGKFDTRRPQRSLGVWPGPAGGVVLHKGDQIWAFPLAGEPIKLSVAAALRQARTGPIYLLEPPSPEPEPGAKRANGEWVRQKLDLWRFESIGDDGLTGADACLGWIGAALLGAVPAFRVHMLMYAMAGSGKTTFLMFVHALLSAVSGDLLTSFSDAGFREDISGMARPIVMDEIEAQDTREAQGAIDRVLDILLRMATGTGATHKQSDNAGGTRTQTAVGAVMMAAVTPPALSTALATRVAELRLLPLNTPAPPGEAARVLATEVELKALMADATKLSPKLLWRAITHAPRFRDDAAAIKAVLTEDGEQPRTADLIATLAAGRRLLLADKPLDQSTAREEVRLWRGLLDERVTESTVRNDGQDAFAQLMASDAGVARNDRRLSLGDVVRRVVIDNRDDEDLLRACGLRSMKVDGAPWLFVANHHPALTRIFGNTRFRDWRRSLLYLKDLGEEFAPRPSKASLRFGVGVQERALGIPLTPWLKGLERAGTVRDGDQQWERTSDGTEFMA